MAATTSCPPATCRSQHPVRRSGDSHRCLSDARYTGSAAADRLRSLWVGVAGGERADVRRLPDRHRSRDEQGVVDAVASGSSRTRSWCSSTTLLLTVFLLVIDLFWGWLLSLNFVGVLPPRATENLRRQTRRQNRRGNRRSHSPGEHRIREKQPVDRSPDARRTARRSRESPMTTDETVLTPKPADRRRRRTMRPVAGRAGRVAEAARLTPRRSRRSRGRSRSRRAEAEGRRRSSPHRPRRAGEQEAVVRREGGERPGGVDQGGHRAEGQDRRARSSSSARSSSRSSGSPK